MDPRLFLTSSQQKIEVTTTFTIIKFSNQNNVHILTSILLYKTSQTNSKIIILQKYHKKLKNA